MEFIKGKWYKENSVEERYTKFDYIDNDKLFMGTQHYYEKQFEPSTIGSSWIFYVNQCKREATYSELLKFLPKNHPDLQKQIIQIW